MDCIFLKEGVSFESMNISMKEKDTYERILKYILVYLKSR